LFVEKFQEVPMKEKEPRVDYNEHQLVLYVEKKNGTFGAMKTGSYISKNYIDDFWKKRRNMENDYIEKIRNGQTSPIEYYMTIMELTPSELSLRAKVPLRKVRRHMDPAGFKKASLEELSRYCDVFNIPFVSLFLAVITDGKSARITLEKTNNQLFSVIRLKGGRA
jgi:hypothetical protein